jgi:hypothetical protein
MKLIDQTPLQDENGQVSPVQRLQGTLKYGFDWYPELEAQKAVLAHLSRVLGKGFTVIRNQTLGSSGITIPLVIVGPAGVYAAHVTHLHGTYQAKGEGWGQMFGLNYKPSRVNLITRTQLLARALQAFIERQGVKLPKSVEPIILAANPGLHVETIQPAVRIILVDALERWGAILEGAAPVLSVEAAHEFADRIVNPRPPKKEEPAEAAPIAPDIYQRDAESSRTSDIYRDADDDEAFDPGELEFAFEEGESMETHPELIESSPAVPLSSKAGTKKRILGMTTPQLALLGGMFLIEICLVIGLVLTIFLNS